MPDNCMIRRFLHRQEQHQAYSLHICAGYRFSIAEEVEQMVCGILAMTWIRSTVGAVPWRPPPIANAPAAFCKYCGCDNEWYPR